MISFMTISVPLIEMVRHEDDFKYSVEMLSRMVKQPSVNISRGSLQWPNFENRDQARLSAAM
jgi:hypothetical protein